MANRTRPIIMRLAVTEYEKELIEKKMQQLGTKNFGAYARKMLIDGYIIKVDYTQQKKLAAAVSRVASNINQICRRINSTGHFYADDIAELKERQGEIWQLPKGISLIGDIQERIRLIDSKGYEHKAKLTILKEAARTLNYLTENNLLQYADLKKKVKDVHSSYDRTSKELKGVEARLREVQSLIKNISNYQRLKPVYDAFKKAKDKPGFKAKHEAELVIFEAARSTLLAMRGDEKLPSLKTLQAEQQRLLEDQQRLYDERAKLKKEARMIDTLKANVDDFLKPAIIQEHENIKNNQRE